MSAARDRLRADVEALAAMAPRDSAGAGERAAAAWARDRLAAAGARDARVEPFRGQATYAWSHGAHALAGMAAAALGGVPGAVLAAAAFASLDLEVSTRGQWVRRLLPSGEGANAIARIPPSGERRTATIVFAAHIDGAHTGLLWRAIADDAKGAARRRRRRALSPLAAPLGGALALAAAGSLSGRRRLRALAAALCAVNAAALLDIVRSPTVPAANDNATGVAALLELARRLSADPVDGVEVLLVAPGAEESGSDGFAAFLDAHPLDPATTFVLALDSLGSGTPAQLRAEATLLPHAYRSRDLELVDAGARLQGEPPPPRWRLGGWTDGAVALFRGLPSACLVSFGDHGRITRYHVLEDTPDGVDFACVERCTAIAEGTARALAARR